MQSTTMQKSRKKRLMGQALVEIQVFLVHLFLKSTSQLATTYKRTMTLTPVCQRQVNFTGCKLRNTLLGYSIY